MPEKRKKKRKIFPIFGWVIDIVDLALNFLPGKAATAMLLMGLVAGGYGGFQYGVGSVDILECPTCPECPEFPTCPEVPECPEQVECPECPKALEDYTCEEISDALKGKCACESVPQSNY